MRKRKRDEIKAQEAPSQTTTLADALAYSGERG